MNKERKNIYNNQTNGMTMEEEGHEISEWSNSETIEKEENYSGRELLAFNESIHIE